MDGSYFPARDDLHGRVVGILAAQSLREPEGLEPAMTLESLGIDSLGMAEILFAIEESFDVSVPFGAGAEDAAEAIDLRTVGSVCLAVEALVRAQKG